jgi:hypothetical protein
MRSLLGRVSQWLTNVPERNPYLAMVWLLLGCLTIAPNFLLSQQDTNELAHFALGLYAFLDAALYFVPNDLHREKVALRVGGLSFLLVVALPLSLLPLIVHASKASWVLVLLPILICGPVLVIFACLEYAYRRQTRRRS